MSPDFGKVRQDYLMKGLVHQAKAFGLHPKAKGNTEAFKAKNCHDWICVLNDHSSCCAEKGSKGSKILERKKYRQEYRQEIMIASTRE